MLHTRSTDGLSPDLSMFHPPTSRRFLHFISTAWQAQICCTPLCTAPRPGTKSPPAQSFIPHSFYASVSCTCLAITTHTFPDTLQEGVCESPSRTVIGEAATLGQSAATGGSPGL